MAHNYMTMLDYAREKDPDGKIRASAVAAILNQESPITQDMPVTECNDGTTHLVTVMAGLPTPGYRRAYEGIEARKGSTTQFREGTGLMEIHSAVDELVINLNKDNEAQHRALQDYMFLQGMAHQLESDILYSDIATYPERFNGIAPRYNNLGLPSNKPTANNYLNQVIDGGGTTANVQTSMYLIGWGMQTVFGIYPKGTFAGIQVNDKGEQLFTDADGKKYFGKMTQYLLYAGLVIKDWRYIVRIANLENGDTFDSDLLVDALNTIPTLGGVNPVFYCNRATRTRIEKAAKNNSNVFHTMENPFGGTVPAVRGVPIKVSDSILSTEAVLT